jgi:hypothetical protein
MQVTECKETDVKRDMELVRDILLRIEEDQQFDGTRWTSGDCLPIDNHSQKEIAYHLIMLINEGFITGQIGMDMPLISQLTWNGHELLDDIRDPGVWEKTKERAKGLASVGIAFMWEIAKSEIRQRLKLPLP